MPLDAAMDAAALALSAGAVVIVLLIVPFVAVGYRRRGGLGFWRTVGWAATIVYAFAIWTYTILPLPDPDHAWCVGAILDPLTGVQGALHYAGEGVPLLRNPVVQEMALNVVFFVPLGFLLRTMFRRGAVAAAVIGFGVSLLVETTQLTGVWGLLPCAHRFFDVADLATNTTGAVLGSLLGAVAVRPRGASGHSDGDPAAPRPVTAGRRLIGGLVDLVAAELLAGAVRVGVALGGMLGGATSASASAVASAVAVTVAGTLSAFVVQAAFVLTTGATLGERAVLLRAVPGRLGAVVARPLRLLAGIGGCVLLSGAGLDLAAALLALANAVAMLFTPSRRSLSQLLSDLRVADAREVAPAQEVTATQEVAPAQEVTAAREIAPARADPTAVSRAAPARRGRRVPRP